MSPRRSASIRDVARTANVSTATVSRVLNKPGLVASDTANRVHRAIRELSYHPNIFAQGLMTRKSRLLGVALPDLHGEFYSEILRGADGEARRLGYHLLVSSEVQDGESALVTSSASGLVGGMVVMVTEPNQKLWHQARDASVPVVVIDRDVHDSGVDSVIIDNAHGTRQATQHLLASVSPQRCFFIGGPATNFDTRQRSAAFLEVIAERSHHSAAGQTSFREYSVEWGEHCTRDVLARMPGDSTEPVGFLAANDEIALGVVRAGHALGLTVPGNLRVIGFDDSRLASLLSPSLSSVRVPRAQVGVAAIATLVSRIESDEPGSEANVTTLPTELIVRQSSP